jgi:hypothetical protein
VYYASLRKENPNYADMMRFVDLKYVESAMPRTMKLTGLKRVNLLGSASSESDPDMYLLTYSKA